MGTSISNFQQASNVSGNEIPKHEVYREENKLALRVIYEYDVPTKSGERLQVEFTRCVNSPRLATWWSVTTYCYNEYGCSSRYNPTIVRSVRHNERGDYVVPSLDIDWVLEATDENMERIFHEIERQAF